MVGARDKIRREDDNLNIDLSIAHLFFCGTSDNGCVNGWELGPALDRCRKVGVGNESDNPYQTGRFDVKGFLLLCAFLAGGVRNYFLIARKQLVGEALLLEEWLFSLIFSGIKSAYRDPQPSKRRAFMQLR